MGSESPKVTLTLTPETEATLLERAAREGQDVSAYAETVFANAFADDPDDLTQGQIKEIQVGVQRGLDAIERGQWCTLDAYVAEVMEQRAARDRS
jgi:hypothetical protein